MKHIMVCQATRNSLVSCSNRSFVPTCMLKFSWCLRNKGLRSTLHLVWLRVASVYRIESRKGIASKQTRPTSVCQEVLNLKPGELVEVKSEREILATLDVDGKNQGLLWMRGMRSYCGKRYRVFKRVETILLESNGKLRKMRNTVLLEGVMCDGSEFYGCDRSCFHYWREAWLRKVETRIDRVTQPGGSS